MSHILIHGNNTGLVDHRDLFPTQIVFDKSLSDLEEVDFYLQRFVNTNSRSIETASAIFIKYSLTNNYSELIGLRLGHYIRLSKELKDGRCLPIIFLGNETPIEILKLTTLGVILATPGTYYVREEIESITRVVNRLKNGQLPSLINYKDYINKISIPPPANYESHHEIANEWSILRWSKVLGLKEDEPRLAKVKQTVESLLFYKYLIAEYPIDQEADKTKFVVKNQGKILFIDDEWDKGWNVVLEQLFSYSPSLKDKFMPLRINFRDLQPEEVVKTCTEQIRNISPEVVILDLRICNNDFAENKKANDFTGYKILKKIKEINPGIQVIIFSATNKIWNLLELQNAGADNFIMKESPEVKIEKDFLKESILKFIEALDYSLRRSFLKELIKKCFLIKQYLNEQYVEENNEYNKFINNLKIQLEVATSALLSINLKKPVTIDIAYLAFYNFLEIFKSYYLFYNKTDYRYYLGFEESLLKRYQFNQGKLNSNEDFVVNNKMDSPSWFVTLAGLFVDYFQISQKPYKEIEALKRIADKRNAYIHSDKSFFNREELEQIVEISLKACSRLKE